MGVILKAGGFATVVCPSFLKRNWEHEFKKFAPEVTVKICDSRSGFERQDHQVCIVSYSQLQRSQKVFFNCTTVVADEVHYLKNINAQRTNYFHEILEGSRPTYFVGLSGTPIKNRVGEYYSLLCLCSYNPRETNGKRVNRKFSYWSFCDTFSNRVEIKIGKRRIIKHKGTRNIPLLKSYLNQKYIRRKSEDVLDLPALVYKDVIVNYKGDKELEKAWDSHKAGVKLSEHVMTSKKKSAMVKAKFTLEYIKNLVEEGCGQLIVFTDHPDVCSFIKDRVKIKCEVIHGGVLSDRRANIVEAFQEGKIDLLVATIGSASVGFNLTKANNIIFNDVSWSVADNLQAKKRIHRIGQNKRCVIHRILGSKIDEMILKLLDEKEKVLRDAL